MLSGNMRLLGCFFLPLILAVALSGCASYVTPGGSVKLAELSDAGITVPGAAANQAKPTETDKNAPGGVNPGKLTQTEINAYLTTKPTASFPAKIAVARVQAPGYASQSNSGFGTGRYSVVTTRDVESDENFRRLEAMPGGAGFGPLNRILLPMELGSFDALRVAAARLKADVLLVYTFDTSFRVGKKQIEPQTLISLGLLPNKEVAVTTTASAAFFDVRTEFLYGLAEASARKSRHANVWGSANAVDELRITTERDAFDALVPEIEAAWAGIVAEHTSAMSGVDSKARASLVP